MPPSRTQPRLERLEDRLALSWGATPPIRVILPFATSAAAGHGTATISKNEIDYYRFAAPVSGSYRIEAMPRGNLDTVLGVYSAAGARLAFNDDIGPTSHGSRVTINLASGRVYFLGITNYTNTPGGAYNWAVRLIPTAAPRDDGFENNDTLAAARDLGALSARKTLAGLVMADAADWFRFRMPAADTSRHFVSLSFRHAQGDLDLRLTGAGGNVLRSSAGSADGERVSLQGLAAGTYWVQVYGYQGARNPTYTLDIEPSTGAGPPAESKVLYLNFDGATISHADLVRWAGSDWSSMLTTLDADGNGVNVGRFLPNRADREQVIARMMQLLREDLSRFGIEVRRTTGLAVEGVGATTVFLGQSSLSSGTHLASQVDIGNDNATDIAFVGNESWGSAESAALALADVTLHEAGHTWGLWHVDSGNAPEAMGYRYAAAPGLSRAANTSFLDRTYPAFVGANGAAHGPGPQNAYRTMLAAFGGVAVSEVQAVPAGRRAGAEALAVLLGGCGCSLCRAASEP